MRRRGYRRFEVCIVPEIARPRGGIGIRVRLRTCARKGMEVQVLSGACCYRRAVGFAFWARAIPAAGSFVFSAPETRAGWGVGRLAIVDHD
jgi:hypothetical protein